MLSDCRIQGGDAAAFQLIKDAHDVLSNPVKRRRFFLLSCRLDRPIVTVAWRH